MIRISVGLVFVAVFLVTGCDDTFVRMHVEDTMPEPVIHLKEEMAVYKIQVSKIAHLKDEQFQEIIYWRIAAKSREQEKFMDEIRYAHVPEGFDIYTAAKQLNYGYYVVTIGEAVHRIAGGGFIVLRNRKGRLSVLSIDEPYKYEDTFFECIDKTLYFEDEVKSNCLNEEHLKPKFRNKG